MLPLGHDCQPCSQSSRYPGEKVFLPVLLHKPRGVLCLGPTAQVQGSM